MAPLSRVAVLLLLVGGAAPPLPAQLSAKAFDKAVGGEVKDALAVQRAGLAQAFVALDGSLDALLVVVGQGGLDEDDLDGLFDDLQAFQAAVLASLYEVHETFEDGVGQLLEEFAPGGVFGDEFPDALAPGRGGRLDALREAAAREVERAIRKARKRLARTVKRIESKTDWRVAARLHPPGAPLEQQLSESGTGLVVWQNTRLSADLALGASRRDESGDGRVWLGGTAGLFALASTPDLEAFVLPPGGEAGVPEVDPDSERWTLTDTEIDEGPYTYLVREPDNTMVVTLGITVP